MPSGGTVWGAAPSFARSAGRAACMRQFAGRRALSWEGPALPLSLSLTSARLLANSGVIPASRQIDDPIRTFAYGTDASFYRLTPKVRLLQCKRNIHQQAC